MAAQGLSGFYGAVFKRSTAAFALIRTTGGRILLLRSASGGWELPGGVVKGGEDPRAAARRIASGLLGTGFDVGRILALDCVQGSAGQGDSTAFVYDGGTLTTAVTDFTGAGGERAARFVPVQECLKVLGEAAAGRLAAALTALELGTVTELVDGRPARGEAATPPPHRRLMPPVDGFAAVLGG